jgi:hypothetical protein
MGQVMRQIGVVIGLTVVLTFPVTVVSGAGSQKHFDHVVRYGGTGANAPAQVQGVSRAGEKPARSWPIHHEPRR